MNYSDFIKVIKEEKLESVYLFTGEEEYLMRKVVGILKEKYINPSFESLNYVTIDSKEADFSSILNACETLPFMGEKKIVIVNDIESIIENDSDDLSKKLSKYIEQLDSYLLLILIDKRNKLKKTTSIYKKVKKLNRVVEFSNLKGRDINLWVENTAKRKGKKIDSSNISYFLNKSTYSNYGSSKTLYDLENEFLKVVSYSQGAEITKEDIDMVLVKTLDNNIFDLLKNIADKNGDEALKTFHEIHISKEPVQKVLYMIIRHLRLLLMYKFYKQKGYTENETRSKMKISPYEFKNISYQSKGFTQKRLAIALNEILDLDVKQKTSSQDEKLALEILIVKLCNAM